MEYSIIDFFKLLGSLGLFLYGMKVMSESLRDIAGKKLKKILGIATGNLFLGIISGLFVTVLVQSSSATTVMVVSFVNAELITFAQSIGVIMGSNIGTTVTAWLISIFEFKVKLDSFALVLVGLTFPFLFSKKRTPKKVAEFLIGIAILFVGLSFLKENVPDIKSNPEILEFLNRFTDLGFLSILIFVGVGAVLTVVIQSSSASTAITIIILANGWISFEMAAAMVLGENIGTTVTANLAATVAKKPAKQAATFHFLFNFIGVIWVLLVFHPFINAIDWLLIQLNGADLSVFITTGEARAKATMGLAIFHTAFNVLNVCLLVWFIPVLVKVVEKIHPVLPLRKEIS